MTRLSPWVVGAVAIAQVDAPAREGQPRPAVLRQAALGDVELGQDLDARDDGGAEPGRRRADLAQPAMDPVAHPQMVALGLDVDVGGAHPHRVGEQLVDQPDHRRLLRLPDQALDIGAGVLAEPSPRSSTIFCSADWPSSQ